MQVRGFVVALVLGLLPAAARAQTPQVAQAAATNESASASLREQLMPSPEVLKLQTHVTLEENSKAPAAAAPQAYRGSGTGYMIAGAALFVAGLLVEGDAGTILVLAGAGIGAYGLYLHFR